MDWKRIKDCGRTALITALSAGTLNCHSGNAAKDFVVIDGNVSEVTKNRFVITERHIDSTGTMCTVKEQVRAFDSLVSGLPFDPYVNARFALNTAAEYGYRARIEGERKTSGNDSFIEGRRFIFDGRTYNID